MLDSGYPAQALAFSIIPAPSAAGKSFVPSVSYTLNNGKSGVITRRPIGFASINRGGTESFIARLKAEFPESEGWKFVAAADDLKGSFSVNSYYVFFNGTLGGGFTFNYVPLEMDPIAGNSTELHWIQRIMSSHKRGSEHGTTENRIAFKGSGNKKKRPDVPFFDVVSKGSSSRSVPPHFEYDVGKNDPENEHEWNSEVYLVSASKKEPKTVIIYNGVNWGWKNSIIKSPLTSVGNF